MSPSILTTAAFGNGATIVGIIVALVIFFVQVKNQVDAYKERIRSANASLVFTVIKRIAVERSVLTRSQYESIRHAHQFEIGAKGNKLAPFRLALDCALKEIFSNPFLLSDQRKEIISIVQECEKTDVSAAVDDRRSISDIFSILDIGMTTVSAVAAVAVGVVTAFGLKQIAKGTALMGITPMLYIILFILFLISATLTIIWPLQAHRRRQSRNISSIDLAALRDVDTGR